jgi:hypothetical protein
MKDSPCGVLATAKNMEDRTFSVAAAGATIVTAAINDIKLKVLSSNGEIV